MVVKSDSPFNNLNEFFNYAKEHPGELSVGGFGTASAHFLAFTRLKSRAGDPDVRWVAYDGGAEAVVAGLGGHISAVHTNPGIIQEHVKAGKMKVLGISATSTTFPDYVPYTDQGYDLTTAHWRGVMAHGDLNDELAQKVYEVMEKVVADPEFIEYTVNDGVEFGMMGSPAEFQQWYSNEVVETRELMEKFNMIKK
jgi:tripartite-type tricarboxylate transporter receptor subunit TctC